MEQYKEEIFIAVISVRALDGHKRVLIESHLVTTEPRSTLARPVHGVAQPKVLALALLRAVRAPQVVVARVCAHFALGKKERMKSKLASKRELPHSDSYIFSLNFKIIIKDIDHHIDTI